MFSTVEEVYGFIGLLSILVDCRQWRPVPDDARLASSLIFVLQE